MKDIAILVVADGIGDKVRQRFKQCLTASNSKSSFDVLIMGETKKRKDGELFNKCKLLNSGLKQLFKCNYEVIIQTDIDLICPPNLLDATLASVKSKPKSCVHSAMCGLTEDELNKYKSYNDYPFSKWNGYKKIYATGCWNGMNPEMWKLSGGFNEDMVDWGYEDRDWRYRSINNGIKWTDLYNYPLMHVNHKRRNRDVSVTNKKIATESSLKGKTNWL